MDLEYSCAEWATNDWKIEKSLLAFKKTDIYSRISYLPYYTLISYTLHATNPSHIIIFNRMIKKKPKLSLLIKLEYTKNSLHLFMTSKL